MGKMVSAFNINMYIKTVILYYYNFYYCYAVVTLLALNKNYNSMILFYLYWFCKN